MTKFYTKRNRNLSKDLLCTKCQEVKLCECFSWRKYKGVIVSRCSWCKECRRLADRSRHKSEFKYKWGIMGIWFSKKRKKFGVTVDGKFVGRYKTLIEAKEAHFNYLTMEYKKDAKAITNFAREFGDGIAFEQSK